MRMPELPTRGDGALRVGRDMPLYPPVGPTKVSSDIYTSESRWAEERTRIFQNTWYVADRGSEIPEPGDYMIWENFGETVVIVRQPDGGVAAFHNVCQHRGARIVDEAGHCDRFLTCPWHGFLYDSEGTVVGMPDRADFDPAELDGLRAPKVAAEEWGGWIWIYLDGESAPTLESYLGPEIVEELSHYDMANMELLTKRVWEMPVNWKTVVEGFIEVYHVNEAHRVSIGDRLAHRNTYQHLFDRHSMYVVPSTATLDTLLDTQDHIRHAISHYLVFPNTIFNCNPTHIQMFMPVPVDAVNSVYTAWFLVQPGGDQEFIDNMMERWEYFCGVADEDLYAATQVGAASRSMGYTRNIMNERECRIPHFLGNVDKMLAG